MARYPTPGGDLDAWGTLLNGKLAEVEGKAEGATVIANTAIDRANTAVGDAAAALAAAGTGGVDEAQLGTYLGTNGYTTQTANDARYYQRAAVDSAISAAQSVALSRANHTGSQATSTVTGLDAALASKAAAAHGHATADITGLDTALSSKAADAAVVKLTGAQTVGGVKTFSSAPVVPDSSFATSKVAGLDSALAGKAATAHSHVTADVTGLDTALAGKSPTGHTHTTAQVTGLDTALAGKAASSHSHAQADVTGLTAALASMVTKTWNVRPVIYANSSTTFPARAVSIPSGYTGPVDFNSEAYVGHPDPADGVAGDAHIARPA